MLARNIQQRWRPRLIDVNDLRLTVLAFVLAFILLPLLLIQFLLVTMAACALLVWFMIREVR